MEEGSITYLLLILVCLVLSAMFSATETAFASVSRVRIAALAEDGDKKACRLNKVLVNFDRVLTALLILNNIVNIAIATLATLFAAHVFGEGAVEWMTVVTTVVVFLFGESLPKATALMVSESLAYAMAGPMIFLTKAFTPLIFVLNALSRFLIKPIKEENTPTVTEEELESLIDTAEDESIIDEDTGDLLQSALDWGEVQAFEIMTPRVDMNAIDIDDDYTDMLDIIENSIYSRIPVYEQTPDNIIGILHLNHFYKALIDHERVDIRELLMPVNYVHKTMELPDALDVMRRNKCHMVVVNDEYGGTDGILTMEDILEQLVGEIWDESDEIEEEFTQLSDEEAIVDGDMRIYDFFDEVEVDDRDYDEDNATVGGWAMDQLDGNPEIGASFSYKNLTLTVKKLDGRRIEELSVTITPEDEEENQEL